MKLPDGSARLTTFLVASLLALGACSTNDLRGDDVARDSTPPPRSAPGPTCLPPACAYPNQQPGKTATSARSTVKPRH